MLKMRFLVRTSLLLFVLHCVSCSSRKKVVYFQGDKPISADSTTNFRAVYKIDDLVNITVMSQDAEATKPFNLNTYGNYQTTINNSNTLGTLMPKGYLIDQNGEIDFPVIGRIKLAGLNRMQVADTLKRKLKDYLKEPTVNIELLNFKVTILGDVNRPGCYTIPNERFTLLEAIGMAGDLNITGVRKNVLVVRDINGKKTEARIDLTNKEIFNSPFFYVQQNDVVYVEQNRAKRNSSAVNTSILTLVISLTTLAITLVNLIK